MRRLAFVLAAFCVAGLPSSPVAAFNPNPRPAPAGVHLVCADDPSRSCHANTAAVDCPASRTCVGNPADLASDVAVRGTLTLITDEDVTGWDQGADTSADRGTNARLTLMIQYERAGALHTFAETYVLNGEDCGGGGGGGGGGTGGGTGGGGGGGGTIQELALCVPAGAGWNQPAEEQVITSPQLNIVYTIPSAQVARAIAADLTGNAATTATPYLDVVDRLPGTTSNHAADSQASVQQVKVTIRLAP